MAGTRPWAILMPFCPSAAWRHRRKDEPISVDAPPLTRVNRPEALLNRIVTEAPPPKTRAEDPLTE